MLEPRSFPMLLTIILGGFVAFAVAACPTPKPDGGSTDGADEAGGECPPCDCDDKATEGAEPGTPK